MVRVTVTLVLLGLGACSDAGLQPLLDDLPVPDDELGVTGEFCTQRPDEVPFPVKLLVIIDQSASLQCTDPGNARLSALDSAGSTLDALPNVEFGVIGFANWSRTTPFTSDWGTVAPALAPANGSGGPATDYQGGLATALNVLEEDMVASGPSENARTRYVVLFLSDGIPEPRCRAGCDDGDTPPDSLYGVCNTTADIPDDLYVDLNTPCPDYNSEVQILQKVRDLVDLGETYGVGEITVNTVLLFAPDDQVAAICGDVSQFGYVRTEAEPLLRAMAAEGNGTFRDINTSEEIDFLDFDYQSLRAPYNLGEMFAISLVSAPVEGGIAVDSDGDGLDDDTEFAEDLDRLSADSDGDGFDDLLERRNAQRGFDPLDPNVPASGCSRFDDRDGDGLLWCEETWLDTNPLLADTDGDRILDGIEVRLGTDPNVADARVDHDLDGRTTGLELRAGTHPRIYDAQDVLARQIRVSVEATAPEGGGNRCFAWSFEGLRLVESLGSLPAEKGRNRFLLVAEEEPEGLAGGRGRIAVACVEARYLETFKDPADGRIDGLSHDHFVDVAAFDPDVHCLAPGDDPEARPPWAWDTP